MKEGGIFILRWEVVPVPVEYTTENGIMGKFHSPASITHHITALFVIIIKHLALHQFFAQSKGYVCAMASPTLVMTHQICKKEIERL